MIIGLDLGGTNIVAGLINESGLIIEKKSIPTKSISTEKLIKNIYSLLEEFINNSNEKIDYIGIGVPGLVSKDMSLILTCKNLNWVNVPLMDKLKDLNIPILIDNDANVATYGEFKIGSLKGVKNGAIITLGTGIGGGLIIEGKDFRGSFGLGSEIGHMVIGEGFYDCNCGKNGCFETFASATAIIKYAEHLIETTTLKSKLREEKDITAKIVIDLSKKNDEIAVKVFNRFLKYLSIGIVNIINIIDPNVIAIGGGVSGAGDYLLDNLKIEMKKYLFQETFDQTQIVITKLGNDAGIIGAALLAKDFFEDKK